MGRGRVTPDETIERIKATYAMNGNARETSRVLNVPMSTVTKYIDPEIKDEFEQVRTEKRLSVIEHIAIAQIKFIEAMTDPDKLRKAQISEIGSVFETVTKNGLLMAGQATSILGTVTDPSVRLTPDEMEAASKIRAKLAAEASA